MVGDGLQQREGVTGESRTVVSVNYNIKGIRWGFCIFMSLFYSFSMSLAILSLPIIQSFNTASDASEERGVAGELWMAGSNNYNTRGIRWLFYFLLVIVLLFIHITFHLITAVDASPSMWHQALTKREGLPENCGWRTAVITMPREWGEYFALLFTLLYLSIMASIHCPSPLLLYSIGLGYQREGVAWELQTGAMGNEDGELGRHGG